MLMVTTALKRIKHINAVANTLSNFSVAILDFYISKSMIVVGGRYHEKYV